jgi:hypothetical protein
MSVLHFNWEKVSHKPITAVLGVDQRRMDDGSVSWGELALVLEEGVVVLTVNADTDELLVSYELTLPHNGWEASRTLSHAVGEPLGWCWVGMNYRGYYDTFTLALGDVVPAALEPRLMFVGEASRLSCYDLRPVIAEA